MAQDSSESRSKSVDKEIQAVNDTRTAIGNQSLDQGQDQEMKEASPLPADPINGLNGATPNVIESSARSTGQEIDQFDLDGGLLDGALDDYDDLDQDTEDTEVGNGEGDFSADDDDDDDEGDEDNDEANNNNDRQPGSGAAAATTTRSRFSRASPSRKGIQHNTLNLDEVVEPVHSEDSDSDHPMEGSENEEAEDAPEVDPGEEEEEEDEDDDADADDDDDDDDEEDVDEGEEGDEEEDEPNEPEAPPTRAGASLSQKPVLNRPSIPTAEDLKDSGDELSDLSEFDDTDDSDEDDTVLQNKTSPQNNGPPTLNGTISKEALEPESTAVSVGNNNKPILGGRKRSSLGTLHENDPQFIDQDRAKSEQDDQRSESLNNRSRTIETSLRSRKASMTADIKRAENESAAEGAEDEEEEEEDEDEEDEEKNAEMEDIEEHDEADEVEQEEDQETKQMHKDALDALTSIEVEFANLRDKMYEERMLELDEEVEMINSGTHPELSSLMQEIEQKREQRLAVADMGKKHKTDIAQHQYDVTEYQAHCTFQSSRRNTRVELLRDFGKKQRQLMLELTFSSDAQKRKVTADKPILVRERKHRRMAANELRVTKDRRGFPGSTKLAMVGAHELDEDFAAMGLAPTRKQSGRHHATALLPASSTTAHTFSSRNEPSNRWTASTVDNSQASGRLPVSAEFSVRSSKPEIEIYVDGSRCMIDGIWYNPGDSVVVLDAAIGKYNAKYIYLVHDEITLQRTDGSKTRLHLSLFRGRKLCMQPKS
ncbi:hypothetical protein BGZ83_001508 [Gryganskiella cystojenkinii]|nr:hypothetical protein BGZ83_001508 [Gryganskiella cystojenkinii]